MRAYYRLVVVLPCYFQVFFWPTLISIISHMVSLGSIVCSAWMNNSLIMLLYSFDCILQVHHGSVKGTSRMREKLIEYAAEGSVWPYSAEILDPVRLSIVCECPSHILQVASWFTSLSASSQSMPGATSIGAFCSLSSVLPVVRVKNKFAFAPEQLKGGYRDLMLRFHLFLMSV